MRATVHTATECRGGCDPSAQRRKNGVPGGRLTGTRGGAKMVGMVPTLRAGRLMAFAMAFSIAFGSVATCLAAVVATEPSMPCHGTEQHSAPSDSAQLDCCPGEAPNTQSSAPVQQALDSSAPVPVLVAILPLPAEPHLGTRPGMVDAAAGTPKPPGIATYVLVSSFRI